MAGIIKEWKRDGGWVPPDLTPDIDPISGQDLARARVNAQLHPAGHCPCSICDPDGTADIREYNRVLYKQDQPHPTRCFCSTCRPKMHYEYFSEI